MLAQWRAHQANRLISESARDGRILDIGCGSFPYFLAHTSFQQKFAVDQLPPSAQCSGIVWHTLNLNALPQLPFEDGYFSVITMLAVVEHLNPQSLVALFREAHRALRPGGTVIITTPAAWSDGLLHVMAHLRLVSEEEISEHQYAYTLPLLGWYFGMADFPMTKTRFGYFEFGLNMWAMAER
ncbi:MAG: methyltransferase domain-containing protein [Verrucomicrobiia bacterium]